MLVADVAGDSNTSRVLHEGTGDFNPLIVVYEPPGGKPLAGIGYVFSHYEFIELDWHRLTDDEWAQQLLDEPPPRPPWAASFLPTDDAQVFWLPLILSGGETTLYDQTAEGLLD
jgi:hypothetical protein